MIFLFCSGFKTPLGILAIGGLHVLPIWLFALQKDLFTSHFNFLPVWLPLAGMSLQTWMNFKGFQQYYH